VKNAKKDWADFATEAGKLVFGVTTLAGGVVTGSWKMADGVAMAGNKIHDTSELLRIDSQAYQELAYAFKQAGYSSDEFATMMAKLNGTLVSAAKSEEALEKFGDITGFDAAKIFEEDPEDRLALIADLLNTIEDPLKKDEAAMELFGKSALDMQRILSKGSEGINKYRQEARDLNIVMSDDMLDASKKYAETKNYLTSGLEGAKKDLFGPLIPSFTKLMELASEKIASVDWEAFGQRIADWADNAVPRVQELVTGVSDLIDKIRNGAETVAEFVGGWDNLAKIVGILFTLKTGVAGAKAVSSTVILATKLAPLMGVIAPALPIIAGIAVAAFLIYKNWDKLEPLFSKIFDRLKESWDRVWPKLENAGNKIMDMFDLIFDKLGPLVDFYTDYIGEHLDVLLPMVEGFVDDVCDFIDGITDFLEPVLDIITGLVEIAISVMTGDWEGLGAGIEKVLTGVEDGHKLIFQKIGDFVTKFRDDELAKCKVWGDKIVEVFEYIRDIVETIIDVIKAIIEGRFDEVVQDIQDKFSETWEAVKKSAKAFVDNLLKVFAPFIDRIEKLGNKIKDWFSGKKTMTVDIMSNSPVMGAPAAGTPPGYGSGSVTGFASGGIVTSPQFAQIAESGAEAVIPLKNNDRSRGLWERAGELAGFFRGGGAGGAGVSIPVSVAVTVQGGADADTARRLERSGEDIAIKVRKMIYSTVPDVLREMERARVRTSFT